MQLPAVIHMHKDRRANVYLCEIWKFLSIISMGTALAEGLPSSPRTLYQRPQLGPLSSRSSSPQGFLTKIKQRGSDQTQAQVSRPQHTSSWIYSCLLHMGIVADPAEWPVDSSLLGLCARSPVREQFPVSSSQSTDPSCIRFTSNNVPLCSDASGTWPLLTTSVSTTRA